MKKYKQPVKGITIGFPIILLLLGNGCGDISGTVEENKEGAVDQKEDALVSSYWNGPFTDNGPIGYCNNGYLIKGVKCEGSYCDNMYVLCTYVGQTTYINEILPTFSEETGFINTVNWINWEICYSGFVTQIECSGDNCDNITLSCSKVKNYERSGDCYWTNSFSEEQGAMYLSSDYYLAGLKCEESKCDKVSLYGCKMTPKEESKPQPHPVNCYKDMCPSYYYYFPLPDGSPGFMPPPDADDDDVPDNIEDYLLQKYSPFYMFSKESDGRNTERIPPISPWNYITLSAGRPYNGGDSTWVYPLTTQMQLLSMGDDLLVSPKRYDNILDPRLQHETGGTSSTLLPWSTIKALGNVGLFGHVTLSEGGNYYKIEYWQFFAWSDSDQPSSYGDHQADWDTIQLLYDFQNDRIASVTYYMHGFSIPFDLSQGTPYYGFSLAEGNYMEYRGPNYGKNWNQNNDTIENWSKCFEAWNNTLRMFHDPVTGEYTHPMVYIEWGSHEFWPTEEGHTCMDVYGFAYKCSPLHRGDSDRYLTKSVLNVGEVDSKTFPNNEAKLVLRFTGRWGNYGKPDSNKPPPGPALHKSWTWPQRSQVRHRIPASSFE